MKRTRARLVMQMIAVAAGAGATTVALAAAPPSFAGDWEYSVKESTYTSRRAYAAAKLTIRGQDTKRNFMHASAPGDRQGVMGASPIQ